MTAADDLWCDCCGECIPHCSVSARCDVCGIDLCDACGNEPSREFLDEEPSCEHTLVWYGDSKESDNETNVEGCDVCGADVHPGDVYRCGICEIAVCKECSANKPILFSDDEEPCNHDMALWGAEAPSEQTNIADNQLEIDGPPTTTKLNPINDDTSADYCCEICGAPVRLHLTMCHPDDDEEVEDNDEEEEENT